MKKRKLKETRNAAESKRNALRRMASPNSPAWKGARQPVPVAVLKRLCKQQAERTAKRLGSEIQASQQAASAQRAALQARPWAAQLLALVA